MFCQKCGVQNADNAVFCKNCGASMMAQQDAQTNDAPDFQQANQQPNNAPNYQQNAQQPNYQQGYGNYHQQGYQQGYQQNYRQAYQKMEKIYSSNPVQNAIKKAASSGVFLAGVILFSIYALFGLISAFSGGALIQYMNLITRLAGYADEASLILNQAMEAVQSVYTVSTLIGMLPVLAVVLGIWLVYGAGRNVSIAGMKTAGLTILKVIAILQLVFLCLGMGLGIIGVIALIALAGSIPQLANGYLANMSYSYGGYDTYDYSNYGGHDSYYGSATPSYGAEAVLPILIFLLVIALVVFVAIFVINLLLYIKTIKTINTIKNSVDSGEIEGKISMYLIVMLFVNAGMSIFQINIGAICYGVALILFAVALIKLRGELNKLAPVQNNFVDSNANYQAQQIPTNNF